MSRDNDEIIKLLLQQTLGFSSGLGGSLSSLFCGIFPSQEMVDDWMTGATGDRHLIFWLEVTIEVITGTTSWKCSLWCLGNHIWQQPFVPGSTMWTWSHLWLAGSDAWQLGTSVSSSSTFPSTFQPTKKGQNTYLTFHVTVWWFTCWYQISDRFMILWLFSSSRVLFRVF